MDLVHSLPFLSTAITFVFAAAVLTRYVKGRKPHSLMWGIGLVLYGLGTFSEAYLAVWWNPAMLRLWYLTGAMLTAAWLGQGTIFLLVRKPGIAAATAFALLAVSLVSVQLVFAAPLDASAFVSGVPVSTQYGDILTRGAPIVVLTILLNIYGTVGLVGGALWSAWLFWRKRVLRNRMLGNILIATGAMFPASAGTFIGLGLADWLYASELAGAALMFLGFWLATQPQPQERAVRPAPRAAPRDA